MATEKDYCAIHDLATIRAAKSVLRDVTPQCGHDVIGSQELREIQQRLTVWEKKLSKLVQDEED